MPLVVRHFRVINVPQRKPFYITSHGFLITFNNSFVSASIGPSYTFLAYAILGFLAVIFIYEYAPETKCRTLEQISDDLSKRYVSCIYFWIYCFVFGAGLYQKKVLDLLVLLFFFKLHFIQLLSNNTIIHLTKV